MRPGQLPASGLTELRDALNASSLMKTDPRHERTGWKGECTVLLLINTPTALLSLHAFLRTRRGSLRWSASVCRAPPLWAWISPSMLSSPSPRFLSSDALSTHWPGAPDDSAPLGTAPPSPSTPPVAVASEILCDVYSTARGCAAFHPTL